MVLGYVLWGITGTILFFIVVFVMLRTFQDVMERDIAEALSNSNGRKGVLDPNFPEDDWDD
jgi:small-conductance mechanosensitive channel